MPDIRAISRICIDANHETESDEEEEQELKIILTTERRLSVHSQDSLNSRKSEKLRFENEFCPVKQPFETLLEQTSNDDMMSQPLDAPLILVSKDEVPKQLQEAVVPQPLNIDAIQIPAEEIHQPW